MRGEQGERGLTTALDGTAFPTGFVEGPPGPAGKCISARGCFALRAQTFSQALSTNDRVRRKTQPDNQPKVRQECRARKASPAIEVRRASAANEASG